MSGNISYPNLLSRILIGSRFKQQFVVPGQPPWLIKEFLQWYEQHVLDVDIEHIQIDRPIFFIALPRTGGSMLQNILCTHPNISYVTNIIHVFRTCFCAAEHLRKRLNIDAKGERYLNDSVTVNITTPSDAVSFWNEWFNLDPHSLDYKNLEMNDFSKAEIEKIKQTIRKIIWCFGTDGKATRFFTKNPLLIPHVPLLAELFPDAKFVHFLRDPRMCANSLLKLFKLDNQQLELIRKKKSPGFYDNKVFVPYPRLPNLADNIKEYGPEDIRTTAHLWNDSISFVNSVKDRFPSFFEVKYEDLLANPKKEINRIFEFCELPEIGSDNMVFNKKVNNVGVIHHKNVYGNFDIVESICHAHMKEYGYLN